MARDAPPYPHAVLTRPGQEEPVLSPLSRVWVPLTVFAASRALTFMIVWVITLLPPRSGVLSLLVKWDGGWYVVAATEGYPRSTVPGQGLDAATTLPFFPLFPLVIRLFDAVLPGGVEVAAITAGIVTGATAAVVVWLVARVLHGERVATVASALFAFFPSAFVFTMPYSEGIFVTLGGLSLLALLKERWLLAGVAAALATATRPNAIAIAFCCAWAAGVAIVKHRRWKAIVAPALAPLGLVAWFLFLWHHTGDPLVYFDAQEAGFGARIDWGADTIRRIAEFIGQPDDLNVWAAVTSLLFFAIGFVLLVRSRAPAIFVIFVAASMAPLLVRTGLGSLWRYDMAAFPLLIAVARVRSEAAAMTLVGCAAGLMTVLAFVAWTSLAYTP